MEVDMDHIRSYTDGKSGFLVGLFEQMNLPKIFDKHMEKHSGRPTDIPYGIQAEIMMVNLCDDHHPLSRLAEYYQFKDLEGIFHYPIRLDQINDDRFGTFLDKFHESNPRAIYSEIVSTAFIRYGIKVKTINFDTTSKIMWGIYETQEGKEGVISIDYGYSKQKRPDKKQIKIALGSADGILVDAEVLSGNTDDKTYNRDNLDRVESVLDQLKMDKSTFYYIADSAAYSKENFIKANRRKIKLITRIPDNTLIAREISERALQNFDQLQTVTILKRNGIETSYRIFTRTDSEGEVPMTYCLCYSEELRTTKEKSIAKLIEAEKSLIEGWIKIYQKRTFACEADAKAEIETILQKKQQKLKFHDVSLTIETFSKRRPGRPSQKTENTEVSFLSRIVIEHQQDKERIERFIRQQAMFVLCTNDPEISGEALLTEYKTQAMVEKKFQQLKSPHFVNSLYLDSPQRVEALGYLLILSVMALSIAEYVVRREMKKQDKMIIGPGKVKMKRPSLIAIYRMFYNVQTLVYHSGASNQRKFAHPLNESIKTVLRCLEIPESTFIKGSSE